MTTSIVCLRRIEPMHPASYVLPLCRPKPLCQIFSGTMVAKYTMTPLRKVRILRDFLTIWNKY
ncbi:hypothetical protein ACR42D_14260 [Desulfovibrio caledoniensis]